MSDHVATASTRIDAPAARVWQALTDPDQIREYMFGAEVVTDWTPGGPIVWKGVQDGREYQDKGQVLEVKPEQKLVVTHFSPLTGEDDLPENYHTLTYELRPDSSSTEVVLHQDNNLSEEAASTRPRCGSRCSADSSSTWRAEHAAARPALIAFGHEAVHQRRAAERSRAQ